MKWIKTEDGRLLNAERIETIGISKTRDFNYMGERPKNKYVIYCTLRDLRYSIVSSDNLAELEEKLDKLHQCLGIIDLE